ncbi:MAG: hypothetical protein Q8R18_00590 [bacterium]|nr:hypothetical protein [bacterium]
MYKKKMMKYMNFLKAGLHMPLMQIRKRITDTFEKQCNEVGTKEVNRLLKFNVPTPSYHSLGRKNLYLKEILRGISGVMILQ